MTIRRDYYDHEGIKRRVELPHKEANNEEGIPISLPIEQIFGHMNHEFLVRLSEALFAHGLVEPDDFFRPGAHELTRTAILDVARADALSIISLADQLRRK